GYLQFTPMKGYEFFVALYFTIYHLQKTSKYLILKNHSNYNKGFNKIHYFSPIFSFLFYRCAYS
ncbi:hypothetical protein GPU30_09465, partial [Streptococcus thermophilus]|nr:hypothetical protein [Streptococcus thermophilus]